MLTFPALSEPYQTALQHAVTYIQQNHKPRAILVAGSVLRGEGDANSDLDLFAIINGKARQRIQRFFNGVACEMFLNPLSYVPRYFEQEAQDGGGSTLHMFASGHIIFDDEALFPDLQQAAQKILSQPPTPDDTSLLFQRYHIADNLENALDIRYRDPITALMLLHAVISPMLDYYYLSNKLWIPRHKDRLKHLRRSDPELARLFTDLYHVGNQDEAFTIAQQLADKIIGVRGFFEWESPPEDVDHD